MLTHSVREGETLSEMAVVESTMRRTIISETTLGEMAAGKSMFCRIG